MRRLVFLSLHIEDSPEALALGAASVAAAVEARLAARAGAGVEIRLVEDSLSAAGLTGGVGMAGADGRDIDQAKKGIEGIAQRVLREAPDWLGLSVYSWNRSALLAVAARCRAARPGLVVFAGGPEATADPGGLVAGGGVDFVVCGEGESLAADSVEALAAGAGPSKSAVLRAEAEDLDRLPSPWLAGLIGPKEGGVVWELARGCPYRCAYCYEGKGESRLRAFPRARIEAELDFFVSTDVRQVFVLDPTFDADRKRAREVLGLIESRGAGIHWKFEVRAELLDRDLARRFSRLDCSLQVGLQSADPAVSAAVSRPLDLEAFKRGIGLLNGAGVIFGLDLIYGLPLDDLAGFRRSLDFALGLRPNHLDLFPLSVLPGTELAERASELGLAHLAEAPYTVLATRGFTEADLRAAAALARACDFFYSRGRAVAWFLQVLRPLKARPAAFIGRFADWLEDRGTGFTAAADALDSRAVEALQLAFLEREYGAKGLEAQLPALRDVVSLNAAWARALAEGESTELALSYDAEEVFGPAAIDLAAFVRRTPMRRSTVVVEPGPEGPVLRTARGGRKGRARREG
jgi:radical SAM superfamily enzyme YgiQ (UPF0313 family)